jgi:hypothetical protein
MRSLNVALLFLVVTFPTAPPAPAQDSFAGVDLLYPELAHP